MPFYEPGLAELVAEGIAEGRLSFHGSNLEATFESTVVVLAVPTPPGADGSADTGIVEAVAAELAPALGAGAVLVLKSTVPVGTSDRVTAILRDAGSPAVVVSNPEFLAEGTAVEDFFHPSRIVIGTDDEEAAKTMLRLYVHLDAPTLVTDPRSAELVKYGANAHLAMRVSFANEIAALCEAVGADAHQVLLGIGQDPRIGGTYLRPGPGFGGSCLPKDTRALLATAADHGQPLTMVQAAVAVNGDQHRRMLRRIRHAAGGRLADARIAFWGLSFKAGSDDIRESPALALAEAVLDAGGEVTAYDPKAMPVTDHIRRVAHPMEAVKGADVLVVATAWPEFAEADFTEVHDAMRGTTILDLRNTLHPNTIQTAGLTYQGIGKPQR